MFSYSFCLRCLPHHVNFVSLIATTVDHPVEFATVLKMSAEKHHGATAREAPTIITIFSPSPTNHRHSTPRARRSHARHPPLLPPPASMPPTDFRGPDSCCLLGRSLARHPPTPLSLPNPPAPLPRLLVRPQKASLVPAIPCRNAEITPDPRLAGGIIDAAPPPPARATSQHLLPPHPICLKQECPRRQGMDRTSCLSSFRSFCRFSF